MNVWTKVLVAVAVALATGGFASNAGAADAAVAKGSVKGKVVKPDGTPAAGAEVRLTARPQRRAKGAAKADARPQAADAEGKQAAKPKRTPPVAVAQATADANGVFTLSDVPEGNYVIAARLKGAGSARRNVSVSGTSAADVTLTLKERATGKKAGKQPAARARAKGSHAQANALRRPSAARS
jgi:hypothetical protein